MSLFSGAGGLDIGLEQAGWDVVTATDIAPDSMETLRLSQQAQIPIGKRRGTYLEHARLIARRSARACPRT
ncbi:DNA cytosine methyltransferase [Georgenia sp. SUBG003]|uniref:DNA cytosine methyltransferase n=1 Tax=Georgenia sp. SUBG003 TaxID=1497974 RepID=UPI003AB78946